MQENTYVMQLAKILLVLCLLRLPTSLAFSSGAPLSACVDSSDTNVYYRASTGHNSNKRSSKTAWVEVYDPEDESTKLSCVEQSKSYIVKLKANADMKGILIGASRGIFPDMEATELRALSLEVIYKCDKTVTHSKKLKTSEISLPFVTSSKRKGIEFRYAVTFDEYDNLDNTLESFPLCPEEVIATPTPSVSLPPTSAQITSSSASVSTPTVIPTATPTTIPMATPSTPTAIPSTPTATPSTPAPPTCQENCELQDSEKCSKKSSSRNETRRYVTPDGESYICDNMNGIRTIDCESSCTKDLACGMKCKLQCEVESVIKERKFWCKPEKDSSLKDFVKKFDVLVHKSCLCDIV